jgi:hypothetical protein
MGFWMKSVWALAAIVVIACLMVLSRSGGGGHSGTPATSHESPEYFTIKDPARSTVEYGVREGGQTVIYSNGLYR